MFCISLSVIAQESCPQVIPALQQWRGTGGTLSLPVRGSIVIRTTDKAALESTARILISDLKELMGWDYTLRTGKPRKNDICLSLTPPDEELGEEGYVLDFSGYACIKAPAVKGVFWGTRSLLQILLIIKVLFLKVLHAIILNSLIEDLCWMLPESSSRWII